MKIYFANCLEEPSFIKCLMGIETYISIPTDEEYWCWIYKYDLHIYLICLHFRIWFCHSKCTFCSALRVTAREVLDKNVNADIFSMASLKSETFFRKDLSWQISPFLIKQCSKTFPIEMSGFIARSCKNILLYPSGTIHGSLRDVYHALKLQKKAKCYAGKRSYSAAHRTGLLYKSG